MHPAEEIFCEKSNKLRGKTIVIGITGSIAATECFPQRLFVVMST